MMLAESAFRPDADCPPHPLPPVFSVLCFPREMPYIDDWKSPLDRKRRRLCNRLPLFFESPLLPLPLDICRTATRLLQQLAIIWTLVYDVQ